MACGRCFWPVYCTLFLSAPYVPVKCILGVFSLHAIENRHRYSEYTVGYGVVTGNVNRIHTMRFLTVIPRTAQKKYQGCLGIPKWCIVGYSLTCSVRNQYKLAKRTTLNVSLCFIYRDNGRTATTAVN